MCLEHAPGGDLLQYINRHHPRHSRSTARTLDRDSSPRGGDTMDPDSAARMRTSDLESSPTNSSQALDRTLDQDSSWRLITQFYVSEIVDALEYIHGQGVVHRDLKPDSKYQYSFIVEFKTKCQNLIQIFENDHSKRRTSFWTSMRTLYFQAHIFYFRHSDGVAVKRCRTIASDYYHN